MNPKPWYRNFYLQVIVAIVLGVVLGHFNPELGTALKPLGDGFIKLIKMMIAPIIFCTIVHGIASVSDLSKVGRIGIKALFYFEIVSTFALAIGLIVGRIVQPGKGFNIDPADMKMDGISDYVTTAKDDSFVKHIMDIIPDTFVSAFSEGMLLQVLLVSVLTGVALANMGKTGEQLTHLVEKFGDVFFRIIGYIIKLAPIGAFGAMAYTIGKFGIGALVKLLSLVATFYITSILFVILVLGLIAYLSGFNIFKFIRYIKEELLIVLGTSSSESVLPNMMRKMEGLGASKSVVGLVIPAGYSFNLDGTNIYMTLAIWFLAQATNTPLSLQQELLILGIAMLTSKGASGVTGAGFITLIATLQIVPDIPIASVAILLGIDKFMSECRALTNLVGNGVATIVVSRWEGELDRDALSRALSRDRHVNAPVLDTPED